MSLKKDESEKFAWTIAALVMYACGLAWLVYCAFFADRPMMTFF